MTDLIDAMRYPILLLSLEGHIVRANQAAERLLGKDLIGQEIEHILGSFAHVRDGHISITVQGRVLYFDTLLAPLEEAAEGASWILSMVEVTTYHQMQTALQHSEERYRLLAENVSDVLWQVDLKGYLTYVSPSVEQLSGHTPDELVGRDLSSLLPEQAADLVYSTLKEVNSTANLEQRINIKQQHKDGRTLYIELVISPFYDDSGTCQGLIGVARDITEEWTLNHELRKLKRAVEQSAETIVITDRNGFIEYVNPHFTKLTGYTLEEAIGQKPSILKSGTTPQATYEELWATILRGENWSGEFLNTKKNGDTYWESASISPVRSTNGEITHFIAVKQDITDRKQTASMLAKSEERYRQIFERNAAVKLLIDPQTGRIVDANPAAAIYYGYSLNELARLHIWDINQFGEQETRQAMKRAINHGQSQFHFRHRLRSGEVRDVDVYSGPIEVQNRALLFSIIIDVTEQRRAEEALFANHNRLLILYDLNDQLDKELNVDYVARMAAQAAQRLSQAEAVWICTAADEHIEIISAHGDEAKAFIGTRYHFDEAGLTGKAARERETIYVRNVIKDPTYRQVVDGMQQQLSIPLISNQRLIGVLTVETRQDITAETIGALRLLAGRIATVLDNARAYEELSVANHDLDAFAYTVAHDLKNPLSLIVSYVSLLMDLAAEIDKDELLVHLGNIEKTSNKAIDIINSLLMLAVLRRTERPPIEMLDMGEIINEVRDRLTPMLDEYQADLTTPDDWPNAIGVANWVEEVWVNYLTNAMKYGGRPPIIELGAHKQSDGALCYWVRDNGHGITPEEVGKLFTPFTRLRSADPIDGHGIGLSLVKRIVERLNGEVGVDSTVGEGSTFWFTLPATDS